MILAGGVPRERKMLAKASVLLLAILYVVTGEECKVTNPCQVTCGSVKLSLNDSKIVFPQNTTHDKYTFRYTPCAGVQCGNTANTALCQTITTDPSRAWSLGTVASVNWTMLSTSPYTFAAYYTDGDGSRVSNVTLAQDGSNASGQFTYINEDTGKSLYIFALSSSSLGIGGGGNIAGVVGFVLIIVFVLAVITYLIAGALFMYFAKGARGVEIIPNYHFWKDFPFLIKDGALFVISPCYKTDGYEKI